MATRHVALLLRAVMARLRRKSPFAQVPRREVPLTALCAGLLSYMSYTLHLHPAWLGSYNSTPNVWTLGSCLLDGVINRLAALALIISSLSAYSSLRWRPWRGALLQLTWYTLGRIALRWSCTALTLDRVIPFVSAELGSQRWIFLILNHVLRVVGVLEWQLRPSI